MDAKLATSVGMQPWHSQYVTYSGSSSTPKSASDELVNDNLLLKDFLECHSRDILQPQALYIFHFDERTTNELDVLIAPFLYDMKNY